MIAKSGSGLHTSEFGYPETCNICIDLNDSERSLRVMSSFKPGGAFRLMLVGQDPTIRKFPERVKHVLMLDKRNGALSQWLRSLLGASYDRATIYATNVVKCSFARLPSEMEQGALSFLRPYAHNCKRYLVQEVASYKPSLVLTFGEPAHMIFHEMFDNREDVSLKMKDAFTGQFSSVSIEGYKFQYSPCLHIQTYRVAETYGSLVEDFKTGLNALLFNA